MRISIAMATYNGAKYIADQLASFNAQTRLPDELVIVDDGSTDETETIINTFAQTAPFQVRLYRNEKNLGYSGNFNRAIAYTKGDLVFLSDQDDTWYPEKLATIIELAEQHPDALLFMNDAMLTDQDLNEQGVTKLGQIRSAGLDDTDFMMGCCCAVRRELIELCMPIPSGYWGHDRWITNFADGLGAKVISNIPLQYYRRHGNNESNFIANRTTKIRKTDILINDIKSLFKQDSSSKNDEQIVQLKMFLDGVIKAKSRVISNDLARANQLAELISLIEKKIKLQKIRNDIRQKSVLMRITTAIRLWVGGHYRSQSGVKSMLRDVLGR